MMGGTGTRMAADIPKQYLTIHDKPVFYYIVKRFAAIPEIDEICIVNHEDWIDYVKESIADIDFNCRVQVVAGGNNRSESVRNGLRAVEDMAKPDDVVMIHDATHPYADEEGIRQLIAAVKEYGGATMGACQYDTCYQMNENQEIVKVIPRQEIVSGASPEAFLFKNIYEIYCHASEEELASMTSAGAIALAHNIRMKVIPTKILNLKLTYPEDFRLLQLLLDTYFFTE